MRPTYGSSKMQSSKYDDNDLSDSNINSEALDKPHTRPHIEYRSTPDGDVVVLGPHTDLTDNDGRSPRADMKASDQGEGRSSPVPDDGNLEKPRRGHQRNLSEHFYDATTLSNESAYSGPLDLPRNNGYRHHPSMMPTAAGQKHRRVFSGDVSNPPEAHRRINSIGNSAAVQRPIYEQQRQHQRVDSAGLDILTAAAAASREELAAAAGKNIRGPQESWELPSAGARRSPIEIVSYDHGSRPPPPHRQYSSGRSTGSYYVSQYPEHVYPPPPPPHSYYTSPPNPGYARSAPPPPPPPPGGYPVQYARAPEPYHKHSSQGPLQQPSMERSDRDFSTGFSSPPARYPEGASQSDLPNHREGNSMIPPAPVQVPPSHWTGRGTTQGVQTFVTSIAPSEGNRTLPPAARRIPGAESEGLPPPSVHHRKTSSWVPILTGPAEEPDAKPPEGHHRSTSSSISLLGFDVAALDNSDATFLQNLQASTGTSAPPLGSNQPAINDSRLSPVELQSENDDSEENQSRLAPGGTSKRVRRKCTMEGCQNRVVQGGLCIAHGAKRKQCKHPGCTKNVKKAGLCSSHGPARKRCEADGCTKVAVQGGRCIAHGAKKKLCSMDGCSKQAILSGMCKKHHDIHQKDSNRAGTSTEVHSKQVTVDDSQPATSELARPGKAAHKPRHTRGLSIFQEMSADTVGTLLSEEEQLNAARASGHRHRSTFSRDFGSLY